MFSIVLLKNKNKLFLQIVFLLHIFVLLQTMSSYCFQHWIGYICAVTDLTRALVTLHIPSPSFFTPCIHRAFYAVQYRTLCIVQTSLSPSCFTPTMDIGHSIKNRAFYAVHCRNFTLFCRMQVKRMFANQILLTVKLQNQQSAKTISTLGGNLPTCLSLAPTSLPPILSMLSTFFVFANSLPLQQWNCIGIKKSDEFSPGSDSRLRSPLLYRQCRFKTGHWCSQVNFHYHDNHHRFPHHRYHHHRHSKCIIVSTNIKSTITIIIGFPTIRLNDVTAEIIRNEAEVVEVKTIPNVWKGKPCDGVTQYSYI